MIYKTSLYTIFVDMENDAEEFLLIHGLTGAIDKASKKVVNFLKGNTSIDDLSNTPLSPETIKNLVARGYLTQKSPFEERDTLKKMATIFHNRDKGLRNFLFLVAYDCNFRCPYC